ncbi:MAG: DUF4198 domain-containing protein [Deltaproteobacteria bacterium]|jgi:uncharacterized GH25 family protein|nr:DUF4198 domain-containing protein [Deltaproteobacteria bacterium]
MKKNFFSAFLAFSLLFGAQSLTAHDMWTSADNPTPGEPLKLSLGYGHDFPSFEAIPAEELPFFQVRLAGPKGDVPITRDSVDNYKWTTNDPVEAGSYVFVSDVKPIYWSQTPDGWVMKPKNEAPGATSCGYFIESAKGIINVGAPTDAAIVSKPVGLPLELVPKSNPDNLKTGEKLALVVYLDGKPAPGVKVEGRPAGFDKTVGSPEAKAYSSVSSPKGEITFVPLAPGEWILAATLDQPFKEPNVVCDKTAYGTSLHFFVK